MQDHGLSTLCRGKGYSVENLIDEVELIGSGALHQLISEGAEVISL